MKCDEFDSLMQRYLDEEVREEEGEAVRRHVEACARCAREVRRANEELSALVGAFTAEDASARLIGDVRARIEGFIPRRARSRLRSPLAGAAALAGVAAAVLLAIRPSPVEPPPPGPSTGCLQPGSVAIATGLCALPGKGCSFEGSPTADCLPCRLSLASCSTSFSAQPLEEFEVSGSGTAEIWFFRPGGPEAALPPIVSTIRAASGAPGIVLVRDGRVRVANPLGAVESSGARHILLFRGTAPQVF